LREPLAKRDLALKRVQVDAFADAAITNRFDVFL